MFTGESSSMQATGGFLPMLTSLPRASDSQLQLPVDQGRQLQPG